MKMVIMHVMRPELRMKPFHIQRAYWQPRVYQFGDEVRFVPSWAKIIGNTPEGIMRERKRHTEQLKSKALRRGIRRRWLWSLLIGLVISALIFLGT